MKSFKNIYNTIIKFNHYWFNSFPNRKSKEPETLNHSHSCYIQPVLTKVCWILPLAYQVQPFKHKELPVFEFALCCSAPSRMARETHKLWSSSLAAPVDFKKHNQHHCKGIIFTKVFLMTCQSGEPKQVSSLVTLHGSTTPALQRSYKACFISSVIVTDNHFGLAPKFPARFYSCGKKLLKKLWKQSIILHNHLPTHIYWTFEVGQIWLVYFFSLILIGLQMFWVMNLLCSTNTVSKISPLVYVMNILFIFSESQIEMSGIGLSENKVRPWLMPSSDTLLIQICWLP